MREGMTGIAQNRSAPFEPVQPGLNGLTEIDFYRFDLQPTFKMFVKPTFIGPQIAPRHDHKRGDRQQKQKQLTKSHA